MAPSSPPRFTRALLDLALPPDAVDVSGDLTESYLERARAVGRLRAGLWYRRHALACAARFGLERVGSRIVGARVTHGGGGMSIAPGGGGWVSWTDVRFGLRMLVKHPGLTLVGGFALAVGIGMSAGTFSFAVGVMHAEIPVPDARRVVGIKHYEAGGRDGWWLHDFAVFREELSGFEDLAAVRSVRGNLAAVGGAPSIVWAAEVTPQAFDLLRVPPLLGRTLVGADARAGAPPVVLLGHRVWVARFGADPGIVGRTVLVGGDPRTVVGVMPEGFRFPIQHDVWLPLGMQELSGEWGSGRDVRVFGRLAEGVEVAAAQVRLETLVQRLAADHPTTNATSRGRVTPYTKLYSEPAADVALWGFIWLVVLLLMVACANVANLNLARAAARTGELAVRAALGATRGRIVLQVVVESLVLSLLGAAVAIPLAVWGLGWFEDLVAENLPWWSDFGLDVRAYLWVAGLVILTALVSGLVPGLKASGAAVGRVLEEDRARGIRFGAVNSALVVSEVALTVGLLAGAGLMGKGLIRYSTASFGLPEEQIVTANTVLPTDPGPSGAGVSPAETPEEEPEVRRRAGWARSHRELAAALGDAEAVRGIAWASHLPRGRHAEVGIEVEDGGAVASAVEPRVKHARVSPGFFAFLGREPEAGREFEEGDLDEDRLLAVVNEPFVERVFAGRSALGRRFRASCGRAPADRCPPDRPWLEVVGVVPDLGMSAGNPDEAAGYYEPFRPGDDPSVTWLLRTDGDAPATGAALRRAAASVDPGIQVDQEALLEDAAWSETTMLRIMGTAFVALGLMALLLSAASLYALLAFSVARLTRDIGIRIALGADLHRVVSLVLRRVTVQLGLGVALGTVLAFGVVRLFRVLPIDVEPGGPGLLALVAGGMLAAGLGACVGPTRRALAIEPTDALRHE